MTYFLNRLREPSTWASFAALGAILAPRYADQIGQAAPALAAVAGILGAALPDPSKG